MPSRVHAVIVARPGRSARAQLLRTLDALSRQTRRADAITLVFCGDASTVRTSPAVAQLVEGIIEARAGTSFAEAVDLARPRVAAGAALWLLAQDTAPHEHALAQLAGALERSPSSVIAVPKLVRADSAGEIVSFGVSMTTFGRSIELASGELDQGQHDGRDDALGSDIRGILVRGEAREGLRIDRALAGADEGLDLGVRARLAGTRVTLASAARVSVHPHGPAALPASLSQRAYATRRAQLHRRLTYAPALAVPLHWLTLLPLALARTVFHLVGKRPAAVLPEWAAAIAALVRLRPLARSRGRIRSTRTAAWSSLAPLRVDRSDLRRRLDDGHGSEGGAVEELNFFSGGGAWAVLAALVAGIAAFTSLLAWPTLGGGALLPLRDTVSALWRDAAWGLRGTGLEVVGPADPFAAIVAVIGSLWPGAPSFALVLLWLLALPLAVLGGWFAATRVTERPGLRIFAGIAWALAPTFLTALVEGRPTAVLAHLLLPWVFHAAVVAHRSWGAAGTASLLLAAALACAPVLAPAIVVLWLGVVLALLARRMFRGAVRLVWVLAPTAAVFAPLVLWQVQQGNVWAVFADPGFVVAGPSLAADAAGRLVLAGGFPSADLGGWASLVDPALAAWTPVLLAPLALLALGAAASPRWGSGIALLGVAAAGMLTAFLSLGVQVSFVGSEAVAIWPGTGLSLAWAGVLGAALITLESGLTVPRLRVPSAALAALALTICAVPALTALHADRSALTAGPDSTLPAFVAAEARGDRELATLVLTPQNDGGLATEVVWGTSATLGAQATMLSTAVRPQGTDISELAVGLLSPRTFDAPAELAAHGIHFVLLDRVDGAEADAARSFRIAAATALDRRAGFVKVGETDKGALWRLEAEAVDRAEPGRAERATAQSILVVQAIVLLAALLLALPTRASLRAARGRSRVVGRTPGERRPPEPRAVERELAAGEPEPTEPEPTEPEPTEPAAVADAGTPAVGETGEDTPIEEER